MALPSMFHMHLVSDATGETLVAIAKAATVQYQNIRAIEHVHPLVRTQRQLKRVLSDIAQEPGIVLYTVVNKLLADELEKHCQQLKIPCLAVLQPIMQVFESYLGAPQTPTVAGQHVLDADYFRRIDAMNFTMAHDDGRLPDNLSDADIVLLGISRTSKTPTSLYLAQRGYKTTNLPLVPQVPLPEQLLEPHTAFVVCLIANVDRIADVRRNRAVLMADRDLETYVDRDLISAEIAYTRKIAAQYRWPIIDVTRRSIEESATMILKLLQDRKSGMKSEAEPSHA
ncbi:pyruvate, water dikinase regulatory protein [Hyphomicrobium sp.]|jgi:regulator of PEP synthase PpsR (kinase-PPPase family)|uniref:pyruvate, water dikinase regulatory protein n=1 Tax=Hyphomicrobium sp. TaxID=82 RepID=UPI002B8C6EE2|nr:pyruvate, water dikinase regulatory protein [Hyphomicrobium sp.]HVZ04923.1 pyruvate, water dikinase regulatory protein [Hyphomicrobium sp.]